MRLMQNRRDFLASLSPAGAGKSLHQDVDLMLVREQNEGFQPDRNVVAGSGEFRPTEDVTISVARDHAAQFIAHRPRGIRSRAHAAKARHRRA